MNDFRAFQSAPDIWSINTEAHQYPGRDHAVGGIVKFGLDAGRIYPGGVISFENIMIAVAAIHGDVVPADTDQKEGYRAIGGVD